LSTISVIIPTYGRPESLGRCLVGIRQQHRPAEQVLIVTRHGDHDSQNVAYRHGAVSVSVDRPGVIAALNVGLANATGDLIAFTDDDAVPRTDWLANLETALAEDAGLGGIGGRDVQTGVDAQAVPVGRIAWFGRPTGNHHVGVGGQRRVDTLKAVNMCFRRTAIDGLRFDERLRGSGAQPHLEIAFCSRVRRRGWRLAYDPRIIVDHYPDGTAVNKDHIFAVSLSGTTHAAFNQTLAILEDVSAPRKAVFLLWALLVGTRDLPGLAQGTRVPWQRIPYALRGRIEAAAFHASRRLSP
jgi:glycosyltransferase involved in cell wall biosynthesis